MSKNKIIENAKNYYGNKNMIIRYIFIGFILIIIILQFISFQKKRNDNSIVTPLSSGNNIKGLSFADEAMPTDNVHFFNQEKFDRELFSWTTNPETSIVYQKLGLYLSNIKADLLKEEIPQDLAYIAIVESSLRENVFSRDGKAGLRQLNPTIANKYGLTINDEIDERLDTKKSTKAIISYFKDLYSTFKSRTLVAAAYQRGQLELQKDILTQQTSSFYDLWLPYDTSRYIFKLISIKYLVDHPELLNNKVDLKQYVQPNTKTINLGQTDNLISRAKKNGYSYNEIKQLNPRILKYSLPKGDWQIKVLNKQ